MRAAFNFHYEVSILVDLSRPPTLSLSKWAARAIPGQVAKLRHCTIVVANVTQLRLDVLKDIALFLCEKRYWILVFRRADFEFVYEQPNSKQTYLIDRLYGDATMGFMNRRASTYYACPPIDGRYSFCSLPP